MKKKILILLLISISFTNAQTKFKEGYYVSNSNEKVFGLIKDYDWKNSPKKIEFKENIDSSSKIIEINQILEFQIKNDIKFIRVDVEIEKSSAKIGQLNNIKKPQFFKENLVLKVLIEGKANLYQYYENGIEKFFYSYNGSKIEQLLFITYLADEDDFIASKESGENIMPNLTILYDNTFRKQLYLNLNCNNDRNEINKLKYKISDLKMYFEKFNQCSNIIYSKYYGGNKSKYKFKAVAISNFNKVELFDNGNSLYSKNFSTQINLGFGFEIEAILPFNNNKWSLFVVPSYNNYKNSAILYGNPLSLINEQKVEISYNYIQLPIGVRHYFFINDHSSIFINPIYNLKFAIGKNGVFYEETTDKNKEIFKNTRNYGIGLGYNFKRYSIETNFYSNTQILNGAYNKKYADFSSISFQLKYHFN